MKKKIVITAAALLLIGAGAIYAFGSGSISLSGPTQEQLDAAVSQVAESAAQQTAEKLAESSTAQAKELEELRQQVEQFNDALEQKEDTIAPPPASEMQVIQVSSSSVESKPVVPESRPVSTPSTTSAKVQNAGTVFEGYAVTVTDSKTPAVRTGGLDWPITKYYFMDANGDSLGSISSITMNAMIKKYQTAKGDAPGANGEWEFWFAEQFNVYRSLTGSAGNASGSKSTTVPSASPSSKDVDTDAYADEVITLINQKRQNKGLNILEIDNTLMSHSATRAEELSVQYSHVRPDGTKEKSECIVMRRDTPAAAVQAWMDSDPHRDAILNESGRFNYSTIGSGCYQDNAGVLYWVITFGGSSRNSQEPDNDNADTENNASKNSPTAIYSISESELLLTAGEGHQLSVDSSGTEAFL